MLISSSTALRSSAARALVAARDAQLRPTRVGRQANSPRRSRRSSAASIWSRVCGASSAPPAGRPWTAARRALLVVGPQFGASEPRRRQATKASYDTGFMGCKAMQPRGTGTRVPSDNLLIACDYQGIYGRRSAALPPCRLVLALPAMRAPAGSREAPVPVHELMINGCTDDPQMTPGGQREWASDRRSGGEARARW